MDTVTVNVVQSIIPGFTVSGTCAGDSTLFTSTSTDTLGTLTGWIWDFDDNGSSGNTPAPSHLYTDGDSYDVTLTVINNVGCKDSISQNVIINDKPLVSFIATMSSACIPATISFTNTSINAVTHQWLFGNGSTTTEHSPIITYTTPGNYSVTLTSTSAEHCTNYYQQTIHLYQGPEAAFSANPSATITGTNIAFSNNSVNATSYSWDFNDGVSSNDFNPTHNYMLPGTYQVWLYAQNNYNCIDSTSREIVVEQSVTFFMPNALTPNNDGTNDFFGPKGLGINNDEYAFYIYNRWGELVFQSKDVNYLWDGIALNTGNMCPQGVYTWVVFFKNHGGTNHLFRFTGVVTLL